jgi:hypothetical protein
MVAEVGKRKVCAGTRERTALQSGTAVRNGKEIKARD